jgi:hypothetical protein
VIVVRKALLSIVCGALVALFVLPGIAGAAVICVDTTPGNLADNDSIDPSCDTAEPTIGAGLLAAQGQPGTDTVLIGPGNYTLPSAPGETESHYLSSEVLHLRGIGGPHLTMGGTTGTQLGMEIVAGDGSTVEGFSLTIPANADVPTDFGLAIGGYSSSQVYARDLRVDGPAASNAQAILLNHGANLIDSTVALPAQASPTNEAISATSGDVALVHDDLTADVGLNGSGNTITVDRSTIHAWWGLSTDGGTLIVRDSLIDLAKRSNAVGIKLANDNNSNATLLGTFEGDTIVGGEGTSSAGIRVQANQNLETANATIADTVISGPTKALQIWSDAGREAKATVSYSNYDPAKVDINTNLDNMGASGISTYLPTGVTNFAPGFVDAAGGNFHLAPGSALVDAGDPAAPAPGALDIDGDARALAGTCGGEARRDIGADELAPDCAPAGDGGAGDGGGSGGGGSGGPGSGAGGPGGSPAPRRAVPDTTIALRGRHLVETTAANARVTVVIGSTVAGATYRCRVDAKKWRACKATTTLHLKPGRHKVTAIATVAGAADPTPATVRVRVIEADGG